MEWSVDGAAGGEDARHEHDIPDFEGQRVFCLIVEGGFWEGDEAFATGAAESDVGLKCPLLPRETVGLQGVLQALMGEGEELCVAFQAEPEHPGPGGAGECAQQACSQAEGRGVGSYGIEQSW